MTQPTRIKCRMSLGPVTIPVYDDPHLADDRGRYGEFGGRDLSIYLDDGMSHDRRMLTLFHEAIEAINNIYSIGLDHDQINRLEPALKDLFDKNHSILNGEPWE